MICILGTDQNPKQGLKRPQMSETVLLACAQTVDGETIVALPSVKSVAPIAARMTLPRLTDSLDDQLPRGLYYDLFEGYRAWKAKTSTGEWLTRPPVQMGTAGELAVICDLADELDASDPLPSCASARDARPQLRLVRAEVPPAPRDAAGHSSRSALRLVGSTP